MDTDDDDDYAAKPAAGKKKTVEQIYQKKSQLEHILLRPDSYVGSTQKITQHMWVFDAAAWRILSRPITYVPGLYKIFDEILVNAADNKQRDHRMDAIKVSVDAATGTISVWNNGQGIPVVVHKEHGIYVPEMIFGHLLTSSNYDDDEKKVTGGRNGYGAKLANIFSTEFTIETADGKNGKRYKQTFRSNMMQKEAAVITAYAGSDFTCVSFKPELKRFGMTHLDADIVALMHKRVYDMAGVLGKGVKTWLDGAVLHVNSFPEYVALYTTVEPDAPRVWERINSRWEVCLTLTDGTFGQVSFVNGICTTKGGQHVNYLADQVAEAVAANGSKKGKGLEVKPNQAKNFMCLFVNCLVENPAFDSQTKETLTTRTSDFGSTANLSDKFIKEVLGTGIVDRVLTFARYKATAELQRAGGGKRMARFVGLPKLDDANHAGTAKGGNCTLILTEGDSAKSLAIAGLSVVGRDYYGVFPLKGKLLNVREAGHKQIMANAEIQSIVRIMGLQYGEVYTSTKGLRYGSLMIMADQDHDGSHIKGLVINFLHHFWPSLLALPGFLREFITPIVKAVKGKTATSFFTLPEYIAWKTATAAGSSVGTKGWAIKYYKGLGTSTSVEAKEYFAAIDKHQLDFEMDDPTVTGANANDLIDLAFSKKRSDDRKEWLKAFEVGTYVDYSVERMLVSEFITKELILFSVADNVRSIPSVLDGLKPAQRKVLFACFKRNLKGDIKVAQLAGYVSEHAAYHHGEASLTSTMVGMAQNFTGSNNLNLLVPSGQFGTRLMGGKDAASSRYIFTRLSVVTRALFHADDDPLLAYQDDDGQSIEPTHYLPIIPLVLVNGADGIGTGWSTSVPQFNPRDVIGAVRARLAGDAVPELTPWYRGFSGKIERKSGADSASYVSTGVAEVAADGERMTITELPLKRWTQDYKQMLVGFVTGEFGKDAAGDEGGGKKGAGGKKGKAGAAAGGKKTKAGAAAAAAGKKAKATAATAAAAAKAPPKKKAKTKAADDEDGDDDDGGDDDDEDFGAKKKKKKPAVAKKPAAAAPAAAAAAKAAAPGSAKKKGGPTPKKPRAAVSKAAAKKAAAAAAGGEGDDDDDDDGGGGDDGDDDSEFGVGDEPDDDDDDDDDDGGGASDADGVVGNAKLSKGGKPIKEPVWAPKPGEPLVKDFAENHTDTTVSFSLTLTPALAPVVAPAAGRGPEGLTPALKKLFKLESSIPCGNMHLFDGTGTIRKYASPAQIIEDFFGYRLALYAKRKAHLLAKLADETDRLSNRVRFILAIVSGELVLSHRKRSELLAELHDAGYKGFEPMGGSGGGGKAEGDESDGGEDALGTGVAASGSAVDSALLARRYGYLLNQPLLSLTLEKVTALRGELAEKEGALAALKATSADDLWRRDLDALEGALDVFDAEFTADAAQELKARRTFAKSKAGAGKGAAGGGGGGKKGGGGGKKKQPAKKSRRGDWEGEDDEDDESEFDDEADDDEDELVLAPARSKSRPGAPAAAAAAAAPSKPSAAGGKGASASSSSSSAAGGGGGLIRAPPKAKPPAAAAAAAAVRSPIVGGALARAPLVAPSPPKAAFKPASGSGAAAALLGDLSFDDDDELDLGAFRMPSGAGGGAAGGRMSLLSGVGLPAVAAAAKPAKPPKAAAAPKPATKPAAAAPKAAAAPAPAAAGAKPKRAAATAVSYAEADDDDGGGGAIRIDDDSDDGEAAAAARKKPAAAKKQQPAPAAKPKPASKPPPPAAGTKRKAASSRSDDELLFDEEDDEAPAPAPKPKAPKAKKKRDDDDEEEGDDGGGGGAVAAKPPKKSGGKPPPPPPPAAPSARPGRAAAKAVKYTISSDEEDDDGDDDDDELFDEE